MEELIVAALGSVGVRQYLFICLFALTPPCGI